MKTRMFELAGMILIISSCTSGEDPTLDQYSADLSEAIQSTRQTVATHHNQMLAQTNLTAIHRKEQQHASQMAAHMRSLDDALGRVDTCEAYEGATSHEAQRLHAATTSMGQAMHDCASETNHHARAMEDVADIDAARAEERRHRVAMDAWFGHMLAGDGDITDTMQSMMDHGMSMMCEIHDETHDGMHNELHDD